MRRPSAEGFQLPFRYSPSLSLRLNLIAVWAKERPGSAAEAALKQQARADLEKALAGLDAGDPREAWRCANRYRQHLFHGREKRIQAQNVTPDRQGREKRTIEPASKAGAGKPSEPVAPSRQRKCCHRSGGCVRKGETIQVDASRLA